MFIIEGSPKTAGKTLEAGLIAAAELLAEEIFRRACLSPQDVGVIWGRGTGPIDPPSGIVNATKGHLRPNTE